MKCAAAAKTFLVLTGVAVLGAGCGAGRDPEAPPRLRLAHVYEVSAPTHRCGAAEVARELANRGLELQVFPAAQLGHEPELLEQLATGQLEMAIAGPSFLAAWHEPIGVFDAAYLFDDIDHQIEAAQSDMGRQLWEELRRKHGMRVLDNWTYGARHITARRPIRHPDDLRGFRLRLPHARVWQASG
jgi:TRAP-type transport system periplasmic protein